MAPLPVSMTTLTAGIIPNKSQRTWRFTFILWSDHPRFLIRKCPAPFTAVSLAPSVFPRSGWIAKRPGGPPPPPPPESGFILQMRSFSRRQDSVTQLPRHKSGCSGPEDSGSKWPCVCFINKLDPGSHLFILFPKEKTPKTSIWVSGCGFRVGAEDTGMSVSQENQVWPLNPWLTLLPSSCFPLCSPGRGPPGTLHPVMAASLKALCAGMAPFSLLA